MDITVEDIKEWAREEAQHGTETNGTYMIEDEPAIGLKYSPEDGGYLYFTESGAGYMDLPLEVREWIETYDAEEFARSLY